MVPLSSRSFQIPFFLLDDEYTGIRSILKWAQYCHFKSEMDSQVAFEKLHGACIKGHFSKIWTGLNAAFENSNEIQKLDE